MIRVCKYSCLLLFLHSQGTPPLSLEKVKDVDLRNMIIHCTCVDKGLRYYTYYSTTVCMYVCMYVGSRELSLICTKCVFLNLYKSM